MFPSLFLSGLAPILERHYLASWRHLESTAADFCRRIEGVWVGQAGRVTLAGNRYDSPVAKLFYRASDPTAESATERARLLRTLFLSRKGDARQGCRRGRSYAQRSSARSSRTVPSSQEWRRCSDPRE